MTTQYADIYDHITAEMAIYNLAQNSPGYQGCLLAADRLTGVSGPTLDVGCGVGFAVELLASPMFAYESYGVDVSHVAIDRARERTDGALPPERFALMEPGRIPFPDDHFGLVTCFDVLEHLDEPDIRRTLDELRRVLRPGGLMFLSVSTRLAGSADQFGDNLHRTVRDAGWWIDLVEPDDAQVRPRMDDVFMWKRVA